MADNFDKSAILESFIDEVSAYLPEIETNLDRLQQSPGDLTALEETYRRTHTIGGSAAMMDFAVLAHVAQGMEEILGEALDARRPLDAPTIALLRRSYGRMTRLLAAIRAGREDPAIAQEDESDRSAWRGPNSSGLGAVGATGAPSGTPDATPARPRTTGGLQIPEWLAAFAQPGAPSGSMPAAAPTERPTGMPAAPSASGVPGTTGGDPWAGSLSNLPTGQTPAVSGTPSRPGGSAPGAGSSDPWGRSAQGPFAAQQSPAGMPEAASPGSPAPDPWSPGASGAFHRSTANTEMVPTAPPAPRRSADLSTSGALWDQPTDPNLPVAQSPAQMAAAGETNGLALSALDEVRVDADAVRRQVASLRDVVATLREAAQSMENERSELRGFLDGSQDALERLEEWAGQQMGLDLRNSPDHVRRYLPLSVIWVTTARLQRQVALLHNSGRSLTATQEQIEETLDELRGALDAFGQIYASIAAVGGTPESGFSATVAQVHWSPPAPSASSAGTAREALSPGTRAELERTVREELRRELEDDVRDEIAAEVRADEEQRLRHELEIQVRRQILSELAPGLGASAVTSISGGPTPTPRMPFAEAGPRPVQVTSEQSPEALEVFRDEAQEHLQTITVGLTQLERVPGDADALRSIRRAMHTLKGAAGMMGFTPIQDLAHASEDLLDALNDGTIRFSPQVFSVIFDTAEVLDQLISGRIPRQDDQQRTVQPLIERYRALTGISTPSANANAPALGTSGTPDRDEAAEPPASQPDLSVRLQLSKLDELVTIFGELLISRSVHEERLDRLTQLISDTGRVSERLQDVGGQLESSFEAATLPSGTSTSGMLPGRNGAAQGGWGASTAGQMPFTGRGRSPSGAGDFDALELDQYTEFHRLSRGLAEAVADVNTLSREMETLVREIQTSFARENRLSSDFQDRLLKARLVPLQSLVSRLYRAARASALKEGKEIEFFVDGGETEVDRKVFEEIEGPLLHIVRNAVNHGIERPDVRERAGKPRAGRILVSAAYEGNQVAISVRDDGAGINAERIRQSAIARGLIDRTASLSDREAIDLIFRPGMTTADTVTEESGRGVGLDVVRDTVNRLRGTVEVESAPGQGSTFTLKFPISLQIARAVLVRAGQQNLGGSNGGRQPDWPAGLLCACAGPGADDRSARRALPGGPPGTLPGRHAGAGG